MAPFRSVLLIRAASVRSVVAVILMLMFGSMPAGAAQGMLGTVLGVSSSQAEATGAGAAEPSSTSAEPAVPLVAQKTLDDYVNDALKARDVLKAILSNLEGYDRAALARLEVAGRGEGLAWLRTTLLHIAVSSVLGFIALHLYSRWGRRQFASFYNADVVYRSDKIAYLLLRAVFMAVGLVLFAAVMSAVFLAFGTGVPASNQTALVALNSLLLLLALRIVFRNILAPDISTHRLPQLSDGEARGLYRALIGGACLSLVLLSFSLWMERLELPIGPVKLALIAGALLSMLILSAIVIAYRGVIARLIRGDGDTLWRRVFARSWHGLAVLYFVSAWAISTIRILLDLPDATGLVVAPLQALLAAIVGYGLLILVIDRMLLPRLDTPMAQARLAEDIQRAGERAGSEGDEEGALAQARAEASDREAVRSPFRDLLDHGAVILAVFGGIDLLARLWGVNLAASGSWLGSFYQILLIVFFAYMAYQAVKIFIDQQIAKEAPAEQDEEVEVGGTGESRIATLLPLFRNFLLITIVVISAMVVLSELGVNIGPLFAGAGVVGLAVGFGAQTLIRDIFSGAFYLIDDAFRKGEYIDIGSAKGVVEKISIRSMQLRHHRGALTTIPFGEIRQVENFSRDWAIMKLAFRVTYDTDVEKMRKIIKTFGKELLEDEYYGPMFLAPLKSQGIMSMEDSAMIARVKFTTKPGKQFELRKVVYAGLRDLFEKNGIKFAHRQVTVRVAGADDGSPVKSAIAAAAAGGAAMQGWDEADGEAEDGASEPI